MKRPVSFLIFTFAAARQPVPDITQKTVLQFRNFFPADTLSREHNAVAAHDPLLSNALRFARRRVRHPPGRFPHFDRVEWGFDDTENNSEH